MPARLDCSVGGEAGLSDEYHNLRVEDEARSEVTMAVVVKSAVC